jgi:predicted small lipoprotein YifL
MRTAALLAAAALLLLSACGQKGPLYLPDSKGAVVTRGPATATPAPPPATPQPKKPSDPSDPDQSPPPAK